MAPVRYRVPHQNIAVQWYYAEDDEDMYDSGADFSTEVKLPFRLIPIIG